MHQFLRMKGNGKNQGLWVLSLLEKRGYHKTGILVELSVRELVHSDVLAYDPFLGEKKRKHGVEKVELNSSYKRNFITLHVPYTEATKNILNREI